MLKNGIAERGHADTVDEVTAKGTNCFLTGHGGAVAAAHVYDQVLAPHLLDHSAKDSRLRAGQLPGNVAGKIGEDPVGAGPLEAEQRFDDDARFI